MSVWLGNDESRDGHIHRGMLYKIMHDRDTKQFIKRFLFLLGFFILSEILISLAAVVFPMIKAFPKILVISIALCLAALLGYVAAVIFACRRVLRKTNPKEFLMMAVTAYVFVILLNITPRIIAIISHNATLDNLSKNYIVWMFAPMRLFRMFGLNNFYSFAISHSIVIGAIVAVYVYAVNKREAQKGNIKSKRTRIIKKKNPDQTKIKRKKTKIKEKKPMKRRAKTVNILAGKKSHSKHRSKRILNKRTFAHLLKKSGKRRR